MQLLMIWFLPLIVHTFSRNETASARSSYWKHATSDVHIFNSLVTTYSGKDLDNMHGVIDLQTFFTSSCNCMFLVKHTDDFSPDYHFQFCGDCWQKPEIWSKLVPAHVSDNH